MTSAQTAQQTQQSTTPIQHRNIFSLTQLRAELEQEMAGMPFLGWMITYSIRKTIIDLDSLRALLNKHHIKGVDVKPVREATYLKRALASLAKLQEEQVIAKVADDKERLVFVVGEIEKDGVTESLGLRPGMKVRINRQAAAGQDPLEFETKEADEALRPVIAKYAGAWTSRDISDKIVRATLLSKRGFRSREDGGVYFLFAQEIDTLMNLVGFIQDLATNQHNGSYLTYVPVPDLRSAKQNLGRHAHDTVMSELEQLINDLRRFEDAEAREKARPSTIGDMLLHINEVLGATDLYASKLDYSLDDVRERAGKVRAMARAVLDNEAPSAAAKRYDAQHRTAADIAPEAPEAPAETAETAPAPAASAPAPAPEMDADLEELGEMLAAIGR